MVTGEPLIYEYGQWLSIVGTALTTSYQGGNAVALQGTDAVEARIVATADGASNIGSFDYQLQVSNDNVSWDPVMSYRVGTGATAVTHSMSPAAGATLADRLQLGESGQFASHRKAKYTRIAAKTTGGSVRAGDQVSSTMTFTHF